jgi:hypothetical protein
MVVKFFVMFVNMLKISKEHSFISLSICIFYRSVMRCRVFFNDIYWGVGCIVSIFV